MVSQGFLQIFDSILSTMSDVAARAQTQCYFQLSPGEDFTPPPPESQIPPQKNTQNTKNIKKCIKFTPPPRYVSPPPEPGV